MGMSYDALAYDQSKASRNLRAAGRDESLSIDRVAHRDPRNTRVGVRLVMLDVIAAAEARADAEDAAYIRDRADGRARHAFNRGVAR